MPRAAQPAVVTGELALIERIRRRAASSPSAASANVRIGIGDDCAILRPPPKHELLVTTDFSLEGRHFGRETHPASSIGHRALARGLSDLAAMGATPLAAFLSLAIPRSLAKETGFLDGFLDGLLALGAQHGVSLAGGDTSESPSDHLLADIVLLGSAPTLRAMRRDLARPGDLIYVTGALGGAATELQRIFADRAVEDGNEPRTHSGSKPGAPHLASEMWAATTFNPHAHPHLYPQPRLAVGEALLRRKLATACIDISDGLSTDLNHLCEASNVAAEIDAHLLPAHPLSASLSSQDQIAAMLHGGEDYELLFTARPETKMPRSIAGVPITHVGRMLKLKQDAARMTIFSDKDRFSLEPRGWEHLR